MVDGLTLVGKIVKIISIPTTPTHPGATENPTKAGLMIFFVAQDILTHISLLHLSNRFPFFMSETSKSVGTGGTELLFFWGGGF